MLFHIVLKVHIIPWFAMQIISKGNLETTILLVFDAFAAYKFTFSE